MNESVTVFHAKKCKSKLPISPYDDNTFVFQTYNVTSNKQMYDVLVSHFILNIPLHTLKHPIRTFRRKVNLEPYYDECINYIILDIDEVKSEENKNKILEYFKDYKFILGESKSYNGINNFNMKGILFTECIPFSDIKAAVAAIHLELHELCIIDEAVVRKASLNAPISKNNVFANNENGELYKHTPKGINETSNEIKSEYIGSLKKINVGTIANIEATTMENLCLQVFQSMGFIAIRNNVNDSISFKHPEETKTPGGYFWFSSSPYTMHHFNSMKTINIFDDVRKLPLAKILMKKDIDYNDEFLNFNTDTSVISVNEKYLEVTPKISDAIDKFINEDDGLLSIRSPMGTGKSTLISHIVDECHNNDMRVLIITNRISVAHDFGKKYGIKVYNIDKYNVGDSLICQYDSLWRYNIKFFDVVIMDEFISIMMHSRSNLNNNSMNIAKFFGSFNKKLVLADAFLTGYENFILTHKKSNIHLIDNTYRDPTTLYSYDDYNYFVNSIVHHADKHKITVSSTSLQFIYSLQMLLKKRGLNVVTLTADTPASTKKIIYELFEEVDHDKWDVLIYSPTLTVGVSNLNNVNYHFHYDSSMSTDVVSSIQMIKRTRKSKEIHMLIKNKMNYLKTSYNEIRDEYMGNIGRNIEHNYLFDVDDYGEAKLSSIGKKAIKIDTFKNILEFNHKEAMFWLLKYHFFNEPRVIHNKFVGNILTKYSKQVREEKDYVMKSNVDQFLTLNSIEKTSLLLDADADKTMKALAKIDDCIKDCDVSTKAKILDYALKDSQFVEKCKYYSVTFNYTKKIWEDSDVKALISKSIINCENDDLHFFNTLLSFGRAPIYDTYDLKDVNKNKKLKYILTKCGYGNDNHSNGTVRTFGFRGYCVNSRVKEMAHLIK